jgi:hypothetical protein
VLVWATSETATWRHNGDLRDGTDQNTAQTAFESHISKSYSKQAGKRPALHFIKTS